MSMLCVDKDIKAAVFDVDGTLYDYRNGCVPHSAIDAVARLKEKGYFIIVATGRTMAMLNPQITEELAPDYYILSNGALVSDKPLFQKRNGFAGGPDKRLRRGHDFKIPE